MSALPPKADMFSVEIDVCFVPGPDILRLPNSPSAVKREPGMAAGLSVQSAGCEHPARYGMGPPPTISSYGRHFRPAASIALDVDRYVKRREGCVRVRR